LQLARQNAGYILYLLAAIFLLYSLVPTRTHYWDGVLFSLNVEGVQRGDLPTGMLFHPNHLLYSALGYAAYNACLTVGIPIRAITIFQILNIVLATLATWILFTFAKGLTSSRRIAALCAVLFAFGATWWRFATDADAYIAAILFLLLAIRFIAGERPRLLAAAVFHVLAMLFHELAVFAYFPVLVAITSDEQRSKPERLRLACVYVLVTAACVGSIYLAAYQYSDHKAYPSLVAWATSRSSTSQTLQSIKQLFDGYLPSYVKLFAGGKLSSIREFFSILEALGFVICAVCVAFAVYWFRRPIPTAAVEVPAGATRVLWTWLAVYAIFFAWWEPASAFYKLFVWPPTVLLIGVYIVRSATLQQRTRGLLALTVGLAAWNFAAFAFPHSHAGADPVLVLAQQIDRELPKRATIYYEAFAPDDWYLAYFAPGRTWRKLPADLRVPPATSDEPVCLETTALDRLERRDSRRLALDPARRWDLVNRQHNVRLECVKQR
jgi:hypothetical protein